ncbi:hypothetical protein HN604_01000 [archaeon]|jgi:hypothetical protein|nr:hypothetical protein [archaeon]MBT6183108.1 hypothetical protein [archaeon]MBT6606715.1 hypothetical protein [archaeon]MBT7251958.1 hypothetical protein [archaeon]MBT7660641.1 hypothetical protein [archaeon]
MEVSDLQEDYDAVQKEIEESSELEPLEEGRRKLSVVMKIILWIVIFTLVFWSVAWFY